ncbi:IPT/TIG domain-containing protein, partial [Streptomyces sp. NBRC 13847]|uniref:IPT/TIG domain-containing protein n=1 Tax=Streptomyces sp. NBRC 13847 TaxID=3030991 RepID=UPI0025531AE0
MPAPTASGISPTTGSTTGGDSFTITGTNLTGASVTFNGVAATSIVVNGAGTSLTGTTPAGTAGNAPVIITTPAGTTTVPGGFTYAVPAPTVSFLSPNTGPATGGTAFTLVGTRLTGASVTFNGVAATSIV